MSTLHNAPTHPENYETLLNTKITHARNLLTSAGIELPSTAVFRSARNYFRIRSEFAVIQINNSEYSFAMYTQGESNNTPYPVNRFPVASRSINTCMAAMTHLAFRMPEITRGLFAVSFLSNSSDQVIAALKYHRPLDEAWLQAANKLKQQFAENGIDVDFVGRSRKLCLMTGHDSLIETIPCAEQSYKLILTEGCFSQPNYGTCVHMVNYVRNSCLNCTDTDLLELYCGSGTFTICLSGLFRKVLATELTRIPSQNASRSLLLNHIDNVKIVRLSADEVRQAINREREFRRLKLAGIELADYNFGTILIDPPRSGVADNEILSFISKFQRIIYVSCNPVTLKDDLQLLCSTHRIERAAFFDQFPYTKHLETVVVMKRKP